MNPKSARYVLQWEEQPTYFCKTMCSLLESQILVDMTLTCGTYSLRVHKCVVAACSPYLRRQLQREPYVDKVLLGDVRHTVLKALVEFMYCGETCVYEDSMQELIAAANILELRGLRAVLPHKLGVAYDDDRGTTVEVKTPVLFCRGERVRNCDEEIVSTGAYDVQVVDEARVALAKEEAASRHALQLLQNDLATNLFVIEDACTEATVETSLTQQPDCYVNATTGGSVRSDLLTISQMSPSQPVPMTLKQLVEETVADEGTYVMETPRGVAAAAAAKRRRGRPRKIKLEDSACIVQLLDLTDVKDESQSDGEDDSLSLARRCTRSGASRTTSLASLPQNIS